LLINLSISTKPVAIFGPGVPIFEPVPLSNQGLPRCNLARQKAPLESRTSLLNGPPRFHEHNWLTLSLFEDALLWSCLVTQFHHCIRLRFSPVRLLLSSPRT